MFSNTEFNHLKLKLNQLYLSLSGGKVNGETVFSKKVTFGSGDKVIKIYDGKIEGLDSPEGHTYDLEPSSDKSEVTLTEDGEDKTTLPLVATFVGTRANWNGLSAIEKSQYRLVHFTDDNTPPNVFSHIGQIIESTTLNTETKVKAIYGFNTSWIQHTGYMLRGASSGVVANSVTNDGGADSITVSSVASHNHSQNAHKHRIREEYGAQPSSSFNPNNTYSQIAGANAGTKSWQGDPIENTTATNIADGSNYTVNTLPKYKNVYIWERVS